MRIMIPASGGLDSSLLLYEALTGTDREVVAVHYDETLYMPHYPDDFGMRSRKAFEAVADWLRANARDFETVVHPAIVKTDPEGRPFPPDRVARPGFRRRYRIDILRIRWATHGACARDLGAAEVWIAQTTWDRVFGLFQADGRTVEDDFAAAAGPGLGAVTPWLGKEDRGYTGRSRLDCLRRIPEPLHALTLQCYSGETPCRGIRNPVASDGTPLLAGCKVCEPRRFYDAHCRDLSDEDLATVAERIEYLAGFGRHEHRANPETHHFRMIEEVLHRYGGRLCEGLSDGLRWRRGRS